MARTSARRSVCVATPSSGNSIVWSVRARLKTSGATAGRVACWRLLRQSCASAHGLRDPTRSPLQQSRYFVNVRPRTALGRAVSRATTRLNGECSACVQHFAVRINDRRSGSFSPSCGGGLSGCGAETGGPNCYEQHACMLLLRERGLVAYPLRSES
jgi:hypothetical protein